VGFYVAARVHVLNLVLNLVLMLLGGLAAHLVLKYPVSLHVSGYSTKFRMPVTKFKNSK
jgi:hypothetical protein